MPINPPLIDFLTAYDVNLGSPWRLEGDWAICGDIHIPFTDYGFAEKVAIAARKHLKKPRRLLIAGDFFNLDAFSAYLQVINPPTWAVERDSAKALIHYYLDTFQEIRLLMGNHERRLQKFTYGAFDETDLLNLIVANPERVMMSNYGYCTILTENGLFRITHPKNYSINQLAVAEQLAFKHDQHIISFHEHHLSMGWDRYGRHLIVNGGCLVDPSKLAYVALDDSKSGAMMHGFAILKGGYIQLFGDDPFTDWSSYGR